MLQRPELGEAMDALGGRFRLLRGEVLVVAGGCAPPVGRRSQGVWGGRGAGLTLTLGTAGDNFKQTLSLAFLLLPEILGHQSTQNAVA